MMLNSGHNIVYIYNETKWLPIVSLRRPYHMRGLMGRSSLKAVVFAKFVRRMEVHWNNEGLGINDQIL